MLWRHELAHLLSAPPHMSVMQLQNELLQLSSSMWAEFKIQLDGCIQSGIVSAQKRTPPTMSAPQLFTPSTIQLFTQEDFTKNLPSHPTLLSHLQNTVNANISSVKAVTVVFAVPSTTQAVFRVKIEYHVDENDAVDQHVFAYAKYASYDPFLDQIQDNSNEYFALKVLHERAPKLIPEMIIAEFDKEQKQFFLLMEDMTTKGYRALSFQDTDNVHLMKILIRKMAELHAEFYGTEKSLPHGELWVQKFDNKQRGFRKRFEEVRHQEYPEHSFLNPEAKSVIDFATENFSVLFDEKLKRWPSSLMHTDVHFWNALYHEKDDDMILIDWPNMSFRSLLSELAYMLSWSVKTDILLKEEDNFLALYQKHFIEEMEKRNKEVPKEMRDMEQIRTMYIVNLLEIPVCLPLFKEHQFEEISKDSKAFLNEMFSRIFGSVKRLDAVNVAKRFLEQAEEE